MHRVVHGHAWGPTACAGDPRAVEGGEERESNQSRRSIGTGLPFALPEHPAKAIITTAGPFREKVKAEAVLLPSSGAPVAPTLSCCVPDATASATSPQLKGERYTVARPSAYRVRAPITWPPTRCWTLGAQRAVMINLRVTTRPQEAI